jgi:putative transposase
LTENAICRGNGFPFGTETAGEGHLQDICRDLGISQQAFYKWKAKYGGLEVSEAQKLKALEVENCRLKQIVADQALDIQAIRFLLEKKF